MIREVFPRRPLVVTVKDIEEDSHTGDDDDNDDDDNNNSQEQQNQDDDETSDTESWMNESIGYSERDYTYSEEDDECLSDEENVDMDTYSYYDCMHYDSDYV